MSPRRQISSLRGALLAIALVVTGCYDSLVKDACAPGYQLDGHQCRPIVDGGFDAAEGDGPRADAGDAGGDAPDGAIADGGITDGAITDGAIADGAIADGAITDGGITDGAITDGAIADGAIADASPTDAAKLFDAGPLADAADAGVVTPIDAFPGPDALVCVLPEILCSPGCIDPLTDPDNCGRCGNVCASGICTNGFCDGETSGHIVLIGHDYRVRHAAAVRVLANSINLSGASPLTVGVWRGRASAPAMLAAEQALSSAMITLGRTWAKVELGGSPLTAFENIDVLLVAPQPPDTGELAASGDAWRTNLHAFVAGGGVIIALSGAADATPQLLIGAGLMDVGATIDITGQNLVIGVGTDAIAIGVISPYHADTSSAAFATSSAIPVVVDSAGHGVVLHAAPH